MTMQIKIQIHEDENKGYKPSLTPTDGGYEGIWWETRTAAIKEGGALLFEYLTFDGDDSPLMTTEEAEAECQRQMASL
jgi:hypothetical protein